MVYFSATLSTIIKPGWQRTKQGELIMMIMLIMVIVMIMMMMMMIMIIMIKSCQPSSKRLVENKTR